MTKENYMALADVQTVWTNSIKPWITQNYATKQEAKAAHASTATCESIIDELT